MRQLKSLSELAHSATNRHLSRAPGPRLPYPSITAIDKSTILRSPQCACGGGCSRCQTTSPVQSGLTLSQPGDIHEQEADRVADRIMHLERPAPSAQTKTDSLPSLVQRRASQELGTTAAPSIVHQVLRSPGHAMDDGTRSFFEPRLGLDLSGVRMHTDGQAAESARAVDAHAYTVGQDVVFGSGQYAPDTNAGRRLLAHELTHVVQQAGASATSPLIQPIQRSEIRLSRQTVAPTAPPPEAADPKLVRLEESKALHTETLLKAIRELRQVEIAIEKQATPQQLWEFFGPTIWALMLWVKVNVGDPAFAASVSEALRLMRANLNLTSEIHVVPDDVSVCGLVKGAIAFFNGNNAYICERSLTRNRTCLAASITHELFHVVGLTHPGELGNHCATMERDEAMTNPYCITDLTYQIAWGADNTWSARC